MKVNYTSYLAGAIVAIVFTIISCDEKQTTEAKIVQEITTSPYFDLTPPGSTPKIFASGIVSLSDRFEEGIAFSAEGDEIWFSFTNAQWSWFTLIYTKKVDGIWTEPEIPQFTGSFIDATPHLSKDGDKLFFSSIRPSQPPWQPDWYVVYRTDNGWTDPVKYDSLTPMIGFSANNDERIFTILNNHDNGFGGNDIYYSNRVNGQYAPPENMGESINTAHEEWSLVVDPDEDFIIFGSNRPQGNGMGDLYISFHREDSTWTPAQNLGSAINTSGHENGPTISHDGNYLFFHRRDGYVATTSDIYWVDIEVIEAFRPISKE